MRMVMNWAMMRNAVVIFGLLVTMIGINAANALSCVQPTVADSFHQFNDSTGVYRVLEGMFVPVSNVPNVRNRKGQPPAVQYKFIGRHVGSNGAYGNERVWDVTVRPKCVGAWCANYPSQNQKVIGFFKDILQNDRNLQFEENTCGGAAFPAIPSNMQQFVSCLNGVNCPRSKNFSGQQIIELSTERCGAYGPLQNYIGQRVERVPFDLFPKRTRFVRPGDLVTMDHIPSRLNVSLSDQAIVTGLKCG